STANSVSSVPPWVYCAARRARTSLSHGLIVTLCGGRAGAVVDPMLEGDPAEFGCAFEDGAEAFGDADRGLVVGADEARGAGTRKMREQPVTRRRRGLGRE